MAQRLKEITYLRAFAALSIVLIHATSGYITIGPIFGALNQFPRYGSPVFIIMSGFILYHIELKRPSPSYLEFFRHRFLKVAIPYIIWTIIYSTFTLRGHFAGANSLGTAVILKTYFLNILTGTGYVHLYFILIMIQLYALFPYLKKWIEQYPYATITATALISLFFQALIYLHRLTIIVLPSIGISYATLFPGWIIFFCLGIYLKRNLKQIMDFWQNKKLLAALVWVSLLVITLIEGWKTPVKITLRPSVSLYGIATFFLFYLIFNDLKHKVPRKIDQLIEWTANNSLNIYLVHPLILSLLALLFSWGGYLGMVGFYLTGVVFTLLFLYILNCLKALPKRAADKKISAVNPPHS